jgi:glycosyltransferase involved in cell wall biosynthesis
VFFRRRGGESFKWGPGLAGWLTRHVTSYDVVHVHAVFSHSSIAAGRACARAGVPYIVRPLGTLDPWSVARKPWRKKALRALGVDALLRGAATMHYTTSEEQRLAESVVAGLPRGVVIPLAVDADAFVDAGRGPAAEPYVLSLSRLEEKKGVDTLIRAFGRAARGAPRVAWRLVIAGGGREDYVAKLKDAAAASGTGARVEFQGWVTGASKRDLMAGARLFAAPSHQENFGISVVEAMAAGTPVIATPGVNLGSEIARAGAGWVAALDEMSLAGALHDLLGDGERLAAARPRARAFAEQFRWPAVAAALVELYADVSRSRVAQLTLRNA